MYKLRFFFVSLSPWITWVLKIMLRKTPLFLPLMLVVSAGYAYFGSPRYEPEPTPNTDSDIDVINFDGMIDFKASSVAYQRHDFDDDLDSDDQDYGYQSDEESDSQDNSGSDDSDSFDLSYDYDYSDPDKSSESDSDEESDSFEFSYSSDSSDSDDDDDSDDDSDSDDSDSDDDSTLSIDECLLLPAFEASDCIEMNLELFASYSSSVIEETALEALEYDYESEFYNEPCPISGSYSIEYGSTGDGQGYYQTFTMEECAITDDTTFDGSWESEYYDLAWDENQLLPEELGIEVFTQTTFSNNFTVSTSTGMPVEFQESGQSESYTLGDIDSYAEVHTYLENYSQLYIPEYGFDIITDNLEPYYSYEQVINGEVTDYADGITGSYELTDRDGNSLTTVYEDGSITGYLSNGDTLDIQVTF